MEVEDGWFLWTCDEGLHYNIRRKRRWYIQGWRLHRRLVEVCDDCGTERPLS